MLQICLSKFVFSLSAVTAIDTSGIDAIQEIKKMLDKRSIKVQDRSTAWPKYHMIMLVKTIHLFFDMLLICFPLI